MIISIKRWKALVVGAGLLGLAMADRKHDHDDHHPYSSSGQRISPKDQDHGQHGYFHTVWTGLPSVVTLGKNYIFNYTVVDEASNYNDSQYLILCYTNSLVPHSTLDLTNTWTVLSNLSCKSEAL